MSGPIGRQDGLPSQKRVDVLAGELSLNEMGPTAGTAVLLRRRTDGNRVARVPTWFGQQPARVQVVLFLDLLEPVSKAGCACS